MKTRLLIAIAIALTSALPIDSANAVAETCPRNKIRAKFMSRLPRKSQNHALKALYLDEVVPVGELSKLYIHIKKLALDDFSLDPIHIYSAEVESVTQASTYAFTVDPEKCEILKLAQVEMRVK